MDGELLSVVIISYQNTSLVLRRAVCSVKEQEYPDYEVILVDANEPGTDYSLTLREDMEDDPDIKIVSCPCRDSEFAPAKNAGAEAAKGRYIGFLMANDAWNPEYAASQTEILKRQEDAGMVYCGCWQREEDAFSTAYRNEPEKTDGGQAQEGCPLLGKPAVSISQMMFRGGALRETGGFDPELKGQDGYDMWIRISQRYRIAENGRSLVCRYAEEKTPESHSGTVDVTGCLRLYGKHREWYDNNPAEKLLLYEKIAEGCRRSRCYGQWLKYSLAVSRLKGRQKKGSGQ